MASQQEYNMMFKLSAQLGKEFGTTFSSAQKSLGETQKQIQALNKQQSDISAYQKQQQSVEATTKKLADLQQQYENIQREIQETEGFSSSLENKLLDKQRAIEKTSASLEHQTQKLDEMGDALRESGIDTDHLKEKSEELTRQMDALADEQAKAAKSAEEYGDAGVSAFEAVGSALVAAGVMKMMTELIGLYKEAIDSSAAYADEIITVSAQYGVSAQELQSYYYAAELVDVSVDTLTKSMAKNIKSMAAARDGSKQSAEAYEALGISVVNADGTLRDSEKVYWEVIDALGKQTNETERDALAQQLLGKSALELNTLIKAGSGTMKEYAQEAQKAGYILSDDVLATLGALDDAEQKQQNNLTALKNAIGNAVAPEMTKLKELENELLSGLTAFVNENPVLVKSIMALTATAAAALAVYTGYVAVKKTMNAIRTVSTALRAAETKATVTQTVATGAQTVATEGATAAQISLNAAMAANPIGLIITAVAALTAGIAALGIEMAKESDVTKQLTAKSQSELKQIQNLKKEYKEACKSYGETSSEARSLAAEIDELEGKYEVSKQTIGEFAEEVENSGKKAADAKKKYNDLLGEIDATTSESLFLIDKISELSSSTEKAISNRSAISAIVKNITSEYSDIGLVFDENTGKFNKSTEELRRFIEANQEAKKLEAVWAEYTRLLEQASSQKGVLDKTQEERELAGKELSRAYAEYKEYENSFWGRLAGDKAIVSKKGTAYTQAWSKYNVSSKEALEKATKDYEDTLRQIAAIEEEYGKKESSENIEKNAGSLERAVLLVRKGYLTAEKAASKYNLSIEKINNQIEIEKENEENLVLAVQAVKDGFMDASEASDTYGHSVENITGYSKIYDQISALDTLAVAYKDTYDAAEKSITGQYNLWETAAVVIATDIDTINQALTTQLAYWSDYNTDLTNLLNRAKDIDGLAEVIAQIADGSADAVNAIAGMADASDEDLKQMVANWKALQKAQEASATTIAELATGYSEELSEMINAVKDTIDTLDIDSETAALAKAAVDAYAQAIADGKWDAVAAAEEMAKLVANALAISPTDIAVSKVQSYINEHNMQEGDRARWGQDPEFYKVWSEAVQAVGSADQLHSMVSGANNSKAEAPSQEVTVPKTTTTSTSSGTSANFKVNGRTVNSSGGGPKAVEFYASGTESARAGLALVGEEGPELVMMRGGEKVLDAQNTESMLGGSVTITISPSFVVNGGDGDIEDRLREFAGEIVEEVKDALEQSGVDSRRSVYA